MHLMIALAGPGGIEASEAVGQARLVRSTQLPIRGTEGEDAARWEAMGFTLGEKTDDLFRHVDMPQGWTMRPTDHAMWSDVLDDRGRKRAAVFYKAAFYDRNAHVHIVDRYKVSRDYGDGYDRSVSRHHATEDGTVVFATADERLPEYPADESMHAAYFARLDEIERAQRAECRTWLDENRPRWRDPVASWDDPAPLGSIKTPMPTRPTSIAAWRRLREQRRARRRAARAFVRRLRARTEP